MTFSFDNVTKSSLHMHTVRMLRKNNDVMFWNVRMVCATYVMYVCPTLWVTSFPVSANGIKYRAPAQYQS